jgi:peptidyl-prolyl cis-trans isomerase SurA
MKVLLFVICSVLFMTGFSQKKLGTNNNKVVDKIVAVIGEEIILLSDIEQQKMQLKQQGVLGEMTDCQVLEDLLFNKILLNQAKKDSLVVDYAQVKAQVNSRIAQLLQMFQGNVEKLEEYYGKSIDLIKQEMEPLMEEQMLIQNMQQTISANESVTPKEVNNFYNDISVDSLPYIDSKIEYQTLSFFPKPTDEDISKTKSEILAVREKVVNKQLTFSQAAIEFSEDPGSYVQGGDLGWNEKGTMVPKFESYVFALKEGEISSVFKTEFGYHFIKLIERRGNMYRARHVLMSPKVTRLAERNAGKLLDSLRTEITVNRNITFSQAITWFNQKYGPNGSGIVANPNTGETSWLITDLSPDIKAVIQSLREGEVSQVELIQDRQTGKGVRIVMLTSKSSPHVATLKTDYSFFMNATLSLKRKNAMLAWMNKTIQGSLIVIKDPELSSCKFKYNWTKQ